MKYQNTLTLHKKVLKPEKTVIVELIIEQLFLHAHIDESFDTHIRFGLDLLGSRKLSRH